MDEKPKLSGLKLSMITQPVNRPSARPSQGTSQSQMSPAPSDPTDQRRLRNEWKSALRAARFESDFIDFLIALLLTLLTAGSLTLLTGPGESRHIKESVLVVVTFIGWFLLLLPVVSILYIALSYKVAGNTRGQRMNEIRIVARRGGPVSGMRLTVRPVVRWCSFLVVSVLFYAASAIVNLLRHNDAWSTIDLAEILFGVAWFTVPLGMIGFLVVDQLTPFIRSDCRSFTDILTRTKVVFETQPAEAETRSELSEA